MYELNFNCTVQIHLGWFEIYTVENVMFTSIAVYAHAQLSALGAHAHPGWSCDFVNQLARETR